MTRRARLWSAPSMRVLRASWMSSGPWRGDVEDLDALAEMAEEDSSLDAELQEQGLGRRGAPGGTRRGAPVLGPL